MRVFCDAGNPYQRCLAVIVSHQASVSCARARAGARARFLSLQAHGDEIEDFGGRLQLRELSQKMKSGGKVSLQDLMGAGDDRGGGGGAAAWRDTAASLPSGAREPAAGDAVAPPPPAPADGASMRADAARQDAGSCTSGGGLEDLD